MAKQINSVNDFCERITPTLATATFDQKRRLVELLIDQVVVTDDEIEIRYVIPLDSKSEDDRFCHLRKDYRSHPPRGGRGVMPYGMLNNSSAVTRRSLNTRWSSSVAVMSLVMALSVVRIRLIYWPWLYGWLRPLRPLEGWVYRKLRAPPPRPGPPKAKTG